jgi:hypothetical protein
MNVFWEKFTGKKNGNGALFDTKGHKWFVSFCALFSG